MGLTGGLAHTRTKLVTGLNLYTWQGSQLVDPTKRRSATLPCFSDFPELRVECFKFDVTLYRMAKERMGYILESSSLTNLQSSWPFSHRSKDVRIGGSTVVTVLHLLDIGTCISSI